MASRPRTYPSNTGTHARINVTYPRPAGGGPGPSSAVLSFAADSEQVTLNFNNGIAEVDDPLQVISHVATMQEARVASNPDVFVEILPEERSYCSNTEEFYLQGVYDRSNNPIASLSAANIANYRVGPVEVRSVVTGRQGNANDVVMFNATGFVTRVPTVNQLTGIGTGSGSGSIDPNGGPGSELVIRLNALLLWYNVQTGRFVDMTDYVLAYNIVFSANGRVRHIA